MALIDQLDQFNLETLRHSGDPLLRAQEAKIALAQNDLFRQHQVEDEKRRDAARIANALTIFNVEQQAREAAATRAMRRKWEEEAATLGINPKGLSDGELLRQLKLTAETEIDRLDRKALYKRAKELGIPNPEATAEDVLRANVKST